MTFEKTARVMTDFAADGKAETKFDTWAYVTGAPRSGTTFVGKILSTPLEVDYIHEPFNPDCGLPGLTQRYFYLRPEGDEQFRAAVAGIFRYDFRLRTGYFRNDSRWRKAVKAVVGSRGPFHLRLAKLNPFHRAAVIKDPVGCLLTEYLAHHFPIKPVVMLRHPVGFVSSVTRLGWPGELQCLRSQRDLMADYFSGDERFANIDEHDPVMAAAGLWRALNKVLLAQCSRHPEWQVLTHESLSKTPVATFRSLFDNLGLPWSPRVEGTIRRLTAAGNDAQPGKRSSVQAFKRDSGQLFNASLQTLSREQRRRIYEATADVAEPFYDVDSFSLDDA